MIEAQLVCAFGLVLGGSNYWAWKQRERAQREADRNAMLAAIGANVRGLAHDLADLLTVIEFHLSELTDTDDQTRREATETIERAVTSANTLLRALESSTSDARGLGSVEGVVRLTAALLRSQGPPVHLSVDGDLRYDGPDIHAVRLVQNLMFNAVRETRIAGGEVTVHIDDHELSITNPIDDPEKLSDTIYREGVSHRGSTGLGLAVVRQSAEHLGWSLRHEVSEREGRPVVTFVVRKP